MKTNIRSCGIASRRKSTLFPCFLRSINGSSQRECAGSACALPT